MKAGNIHLEFEQVFKRLWGH